MSRMRDGALLDFTDFFNAESDRLLRACWAISLDREVARDVAQEAFTRAWSNWDRVGRRDAARRGLPSPAAWCRTVALNLLRDNWRREQTSRSAVLPAAEPVDLAASDLDLRDALEQLSPRQREALVLHHLLDLPVEECASLMTLSESSVKTHLQRGREQLQQRLGSHSITNKEHRP